MKISFENIKELEQFINTLRIEYAKEHSTDYKKLKTTEISDEDWLGIYSCLEFKEKTKNS